MKKNIPAESMRIERRSFIVKDLIYIQIYK